MPGVDAAFAAWARRATAGLAMARPVAFRCAGSSMILRTKPTLPGAETKKYRIGVRAPSGSLTFAWPPPLGPGARSQTHRPPPPTRERV
eukprot:3863195-Alexandrium_andersonii.AAC.1